MTGASLVTGVSPKEGPPGTRITIRGENLGKDSRDLVGLKICGVDCLLSAEWKSSSKIIARTGAGKGKGDITVTTRSGGTGSCTVGFRGFFMQTGPLQESAVWIDESQTVYAQIGRGRNTSPLLSKDDEDPLGISNEGIRARSEEEMLEVFPDCSGNMSLENFSPPWYLLENHQEASFDDLKMGLNHMRIKARTRAEGPIAFVKTNLGAILDCLDSLNVMYGKFTKDDIQRECINSYAVSLMQAKSCADGLFKEVLGRKDEADATRNALSVLQRFKFLFYLPLNIERNMQKGDYNLVINDYVRARSLFADTQVKIFQKVYKEVEQKIHAFRENLHSKLIRLPNTLEEQKKLIRYLGHLEVSGDPAWECLENQQRWLADLLTQCRDQHVAEPEEPSTGPHLAAPSPNTQAGFARGTRTSVYMSEGTGWRYKTPQKVLFVEELTEIMTNNFPDFWKLAQAYIAGSLVMKEDDSKGSHKPDQNKQNTCKQIITSTITYFSNLLRATFLPHSLDNIPADIKQSYGEWPEGKREVPGAWLPHCVRYIRSCASWLCSLDLPQESHHLVQELAFDMRTHCMVTLLKQAISDVKSLHAKETWVVELDDEFGGTTQLPVLFENIVNETVQHLHEVVVQNKPGESEIFGQRPVQNEATSLCTQLLQAFAPCIEQLAFSSDDTQTPSLRVTGDKVPSSRDMYADENPVPNKDKKLIIMLSNCSYMVRHLLPRLVENLKKHGYDDMNKVLQESQTTYSTLDGRLFEVYIEEKSNPIVGCMEPHMYRGHFDWKTCRHPTGDLDVAGVRNYLKEVVMGMIQVHAEVYSISPSFISRVMTRIVEAVAEEMSRLVQCVPGFGASGALQARLELRALRDTVQVYRSAGSDGSFTEALDYLPDCPDKDLPHIEELLNKYRTQMKFQLMCFTNDSTVKFS